MEKLSMCRVCLGEDIRLVAVVGTHLQEMYESLVLMPFKTEDSRPILACYICRARLKNCYELRKSCLQSEELFTQMLSCNESEEVQLQAINNKKRLTTHNVIHFSVGHVLGMDADSVGVEDLKCEVKDDPNDDEDVVMVDRAIDELLNNSDGDFSSGDEDDEYLTKREPSPVSEEELQPTDESEPAASSRQPDIWLTKTMASRGPKIYEDVLQTQGSSETSVLFSFFEYLGLDFWQLVANETNLYSAQERQLKTVNTNRQEIINFVGLQILMESLSYPQARLYWNRDVSVPLIRDTMTRDRFFELRNYLHFDDNTAALHSDDKLRKIRPMINCILGKCHTLPRSQHMSIDEQMIPFAGRCQCRQYVPSKPNPLDLKNYVLAAKDGLVLDFEIYVGANTLSREVISQFGLGAGIVQLLTRTIRTTCVLYTDRFFTSLKLADYLNKEKPDIYLTGTVMSNRVGIVGKKMKTDKELNRGEFDEKVRNDEKDTKGVTMLSTDTGSDPVGSCKRRCKVQRQKIDVTQPAVVKNYNTCMGGIDSCDRLIAYYRSSMRTKKWPTRVFSHFVDLVIVNCWIMYIRCCKEETVPPKDRLGLLQYRINLGTALAKYESAPATPLFMQPSPSTRAVVKRKNDDDEEQADVSLKKRPRPVVVQPCVESRLDGIGHLPRFQDDKFASKCRYPGCKSRCRTICTKCNMYLCILKNNCFEKYHTSK